MAPEGITTATAGWGAAWCGGVYGLGWLCISSSAVGLPPTLWAPAVNVACAGSSSLVAWRAMQFNLSRHRHGS